MRFLRVYLFVALAAFAIFGLTPGCTSGIPIFSTHAHTLNRIASAEELEVEVNNELATLRNQGLITQAQIDRAFTPQLNKAEQIIKSARMIARASATQPAATQPVGTIDEAKAILLNVRAVLTQLKGGKP